VKILDARFEKSGHIVPASRGTVSAFIDSVTTRVEAIPTSVNVALSAVAPAKAGVQPLEISAEISMTGLRLLKAAGMTKPDEHVHV
jgi:hypothetical protein